MDTAASRPQENDPRSNPELSGAEAGTSLALVEQGAAWPLELLAAAGERSPRLALRARGLWLVPGSVQGSTRGCRARAARPCQPSGHQGRGARLVPAC